MEEIKYYNDYFESATNLPKTFIQIKNEYSKLMKDPYSDIIDIGDIDLVSKSMITNLEQTYPDSTIIEKDKRYFLKIKK